MAWHATERGGSAGVEWGRARRGGVGLGGVGWGVWVEARSRGFGGEGWDRVEWSEVGWGWGGRCGVEMGPS